MEKKANRPILFQGSPKSDRNRALFVGERIDRQGHSMAYPPIDNSDTIVVGLRSASDGCRRTPRAATPTSSTSAGSSNRALPARSSDNPENGPRDRAPASEFARTPRRTSVGFTEGSFGNQAPHDESPEADLVYRHVRNGSRRRPPCPRRDSLPPSVENPRPPTRP